MLDVYANWIERTAASASAAIERAMRRSPANWHQHGTSCQLAGQVIQSSGNRLAEREGFEPDEVTWRISNLLIHLRS
jgi:hypothetical protein